MTIIAQVETELESIQNAAEEYHDRGWVVIPVCKPAQDGCSAGKLHHKRDRHGNVHPCKSPGKRPLNDAWQTSTADDFNPDVFNDDVNVGVVLGENSGWLVDVEFDRPEAAKAADILLPKTAAVFGRDSSPRSHRLYICPGAETVTYDIPATIAVDGRRRIVEVRAGGHQSVLPPSLHASGERVKWYSVGQPAAVEQKTLRKVVRRVAAATVLANVWQEGIRNDASLALAGWLLRGGWKIEDVERFLRAVAAAADDEEAEDRIKTIRRTKEKLVSDRTVTGYPTLVKLLGESVAVFVSDMLAVERENGAEGPQKKVTVKWSGSDAEMKTLLWGKLQETNNPPRLFKRGGAVVRIEILPEGLRVRELDAAGLRYEVESRLRILKRKHDHQNDIVREVEVGITDSFAKQMLAAPYHHIPLPELKRIVHTPIFTRDGKLLSASGFYPEHGILVDIPPHLKLPPIPEKVTETNVNEAKRWLLDELLVDFPFVGEADRANAVALILLPFARELIDGNTPLHVVQAPAHGTGKTLLANVSLGVAGGNVAFLAYQSNNDEMGKTLVSALRDSPTAILFDNVACTVDSDKLALALTTDRYSARLLGVTENVSLPVRCVWVMTSNNAQMSREMVRRSVFITINAKVEHPHLRTGFKHPNLPLWLNQNRGQLVWACLVLVKWWIENGRPQANITFGSYESYASTMGGLMTCIGVDGFLSNAVEQSKRADIESDAWNRFVSAWWDSFQDTPVTVAQLLPLTEYIVGMNIVGADDRARRVSLGKQLRRVEGSKICGFTITEWGESDSKTKAALYKLVPDTGMLSEGSEGSEGFTPHIKLSGKSFAGVCGSSETSETSDMTTECQSTEPPPDDEDPFGDDTAVLVRAVRGAELVGSIRLDDETRERLVSGLSEQQRYTAAGIVQFISTRLLKNGMKTSFNVLVDAYKSWAAENNIQIDVDSFALACVLYAGQPDEELRFPLMVKPEPEATLFEDLPTTEQLEIASTLDAIGRWAETHMETTSCGRFSSRDGNIVTLDKNHQLL